jgi:hypothetical protein
VRVLKTAGCLASGAILSITFLGAAGADLPGSAQPGVWVHHKWVVGYDGSTPYDCTGVGPKIRQMLLYFGARYEGLKVAVTCRGLLGVETEFDSLAPAGEGESDTVPGHWVKLLIRSIDQNRGECDLIRNLKGLLTNNFTVRNLDYRTSCFPNEVTMNEFTVMGQVFQPVEAGSHRPRSAPLD